MGELLEREEHLDELTAVLDEVAGGKGRVVLVGGEAGIGKTALVERFSAAHADTTRVLRGACEALFTPRPLGPLYDIAHQTQGELLNLLKDEEAERFTIFFAFLRELQEGGTPSLVVIEDAHWADEATLDLLTFLGRRVQETATMLIVTYRSDEVDGDHPLKRVLGNFSSEAVHRMRLTPLSETAVETLACQANRPGNDLYEVTGGNPFFITEVLAGEGERVPPTVRDAVLARIAGLSGPARKVLEILAVIPRRTERWLLDELLEPAVSVLDECSRTGVLKIETEALAFRHELARMAAEEALSLPYRQALNERVLEVLGNHDGVALAWLVYHADGTGDGEAVLRYAPAAARRAAALGAHREAASHYQTALRYAENLPSEERAALLEGKSHECHMSGRIEEAIETREEALDIWRARGSRLKESENLRGLSRVVWYAGDGERAEKCARKAVELLESLPPGPERAMATSNLSQQCMLSDQIEEALHWGTRALELAEEFGETETMIHALNNIGTARLMVHDKSGRVRLERSLDLALEHGEHYHAVRAYVNLSSIATLWDPDYAQAIRYQDAGIAYCKDHDLDAMGLGLISERAFVHLRQGRWSEAVEDAAHVLNQQDLPPIDKILPLVVRGVICARQGDDEATSLLDEARDLAMPTGELQRIVPVAAARAEAAWLRNDFKRVVTESRVGFEVAENHRIPWALGEMSFWMWRGESLSEPLEDAAGPFVPHMKGDWRAAAKAWKELECPYEEAVALSDGDEAAQRSAYERFERLGAESAASALRRRLHANGINGLPRGPRPSTRANPEGLTNRQMEVLGLVMEGLTNDEIAERLFISPKTVGHHVSAVLDKLDVGSRVKAATLALERGLVNQNGEENGRK